MKTYQEVNNHDDLLNTVDVLLDEVGLDREELGGKMTFAGMDPIRPTVLKVGCASAAITGANAIASALIWKMRTGESQDIHIDLRKAYVSQSAWQDTLANCTRINGTPHMISGAMGGHGNQVLPCKDGRFVMLTSLYAASEDRVMKLLDSGTLPEQVERATKKWDAAELEKAAQDASVPLVMIRTQEEYKASEQGRIHAAEPLINIEKIGDSDPEPLGPAERPLSGIRALGMCHIVAGPTVLRQLAAQGADCMNLNTLNWVEIPKLYWQCDAGTRQTYLDATHDANRKPIYELVKGADVFVQNLRPHLAAKQGYSPESLAEYRPGIICVDVKLNTNTGPWSDWMGFDFMAGALTGLLCECGTPDQPSPPHGVNVICDFLTGYLGMIGVQAALMRRATEGGSYRVTITLTQTVMFELALGLVDKNTLLDMENMGPEHQHMEPNLQTGQTAFGEFTRLGSQIEMSKTPEYWDTILYPIGSSKPEWLPR
jgi:crotonobetainyl-CoA:carnitine CoA-transferase CaiB-like acyl-CoA transferase